MIVATGCHRSLAAAMARVYCIRFVVGSHRS